MLKRKRVVLFLLVAALLLAPLSVWGGSALANEPYKIGAIFSITGPASSLGIPERDTAIMLEEIINERGGINGYPLQIIIYDDASDPTQARLMAQRLIDQDNVSVIVGPSTSGNSMALIDTMTQAQVPLISAAASKNIVQPIEDRYWIFKTPQDDVIVAMKIIEYLLEKGLTRVAFLYVNDAFGDSGRAEFFEAVEGAAIKIATYGNFDPEDVDMTTHLVRASLSSPQAYIVWAIPPSASIITQNMYDLGLQEPLIQTHGIGNKTFIELAGDAAEGVIFPAGKLLVAEFLDDDDPQKEVVQEYAYQYEEVFGFGPRSTFGGHAHDAIMLAVTAMEEVGPDPALIRDALEEIQGFVGIGGVFNMSPDDHMGLTTEDLALIRIENGEWLLLSY